METWGSALSPLLTPSRLAQPVLMTSGLRTEADVAQAAPEGWRAAAPSVRSHPSFPASTCVDRTQAPFLNERRHDSLTALLCGVRSLICSGSSEMSDASRGTRERAGEVRPGETAAPAETQGPSGNAAELVERVLALGPSVKRSFRLSSRGEEHRVRSLIDDGKEKSPCHWPDRKAMRSLIFRQCRGQRDCSLRGRFDLAMVRL